MNKAELISKVADLTGFTKVDADKAADAVFAAITDALKGGEEVSRVWTGGGCMRPRARPHR